MTKAELLERMEEYARVSWVEWENANPNSQLGYDIEQGWDAALDCITRFIEQEFHD